MDPLHQIMLFIEDFRKELIERSARRQIGDVASINILDDVSQDVI